MSVDVLAKTTLPQFNAELIDAAFEQAVADGDQFRRDQLAVMNHLNGPLGFFQTEKTAAFGGRGESIEGARWLAGYVMGHSALRSAVPEGQPLPARSRQELHGFAAYFSRNPGSMAELVAEDYEQHDSMPKMLGRLARASTHHVEGAQFILGVYSRWANPGRPPLALPRVVLPEQRGNRRAQPFDLTGHFLGGR